MFLIDPARLSSRNDRAIRIDGRVGPKDLQFLSVRDIPETVVDAFRDGGDVAGSDGLFFAGDLSDGVPFQDKNALVAIVLVERN